MYLSNSSGVINSSLNVDIPSMIDSIISTALFPTSRCSKPKSSIFFRPQTNCDDLFNTPDDMPIPESSTLSSRICLAKE